MTRSALATRPAAVAGVLPFGVTRAVAFNSPPVLPATRLDQQLQVAVIGDGTPFPMAPTMATAFTTTAQTQEDSQLDEETENDTD